jgi:eukaryotic-like serine/threonine-protein kinase
LEPLAETNIQNRDPVTDTAKSGLASGLIGAVLSGRYRLESKLGSGGMSTVYLARDETLERFVAVKVLHGEISDQADQLERFRREATTVAQLSHPNVVAVIDAGEDGGHPYIVFERVEGETLKQRIDRLGRLPVDEAVAYAIEIGRGLAAAHGRRLVHRDVKPQNVLIDADGRAKVTDFGIARSLESDGLTKTGRVLGTTDYVSPEQAMGHQVDARSDIYALGVLLFEMLTGKVPFEAETLVGVAMKHVNEPMPNVQKLRPDVSSALAAVIERATAKDPKRRYRDMAAMLTDLETALEVEVARAGGSTGEATTVIESVPTRRRLLPGRKVSVAGIAIVALAAIAAIVIALVTDGEEPAAGGGGGGDAPASGGAIELANAGTFDPIPGDGTEVDDVVEFAIDGDPSGTTWVSEHYDSEDFGNLKDGVGIYVEADDPASPRVMTVQSAEGGWDAQVYAAQGGPPSELGDWEGPIGEISDASTEAEIQLNSTGENRFFLLWFTSLPTSTEDSSRYRAEIADIELTS